MANGPGVSVEERDDGRWRVRWRVRVADDSPRGWSWKSREKVVSDESTAIAVRADVLRDLETGKVPDLRPVFEAPVVASLDDVLAGWARRQKAKGNLARSTLSNHATAIGRILRELRAEHGIPADRPVPGSHLTRPSAIRLTERLHASGLGAGSIYPTIRILLAAWTWACDDPDTFPGIPPAPRDPSDCMPAPPQHALRPSPTLEEVDAMLRQLAAGQTRVALHAAIVMRYTGLRIGGVCAIRVEDVSLSACTLLIRGGKSRREKVERRTIAISEHLRDWLAGQIAGRPGDELLVRRRPDAVRRGGPHASMRAAWEAATKAGHVRRETWDANRDETGEKRKGRPDHAFRAAVTTHLREAGVDRAVVKVLVGQALDMQEKHYIGEDYVRITREAVGKIPPIAWGVALPANVTRLGR